jgi:tyrosyl-tRNA synthetase
MVGKLMSISDELMLRYYELVGEVSSDELEKLKADIASGRKHPRDAKMELAKKIVERFYDRKTADEAEAAFDAQFRRKEMPQEMEIFRHEWKKETEFLSSILSGCGAVKSSSEARRLIKQGAVSVNGEKISDQQFALKSGDYKIRIGKKRYVKIEGR